MSIPVLGGIIFIIVFAGIIFLHELGHFLAAKLMRIEVEEFAFGLPPRLLRLWRGSGSLVINGQKISIPFNKDLPFDHRPAISRTVNATADKVKNRLVLRSIKLAEGGKPPAAAEQEFMTPPPRIAPGNFQEETGEIKLSGTLDEVNPGTEVTLNWIPLGGFNRLKGEENPGITHGMAAAHPFRRIVVLLGGAFMNLLTGVIVYMVLFSQIGLPDTTKVVIGEVLTGMPAEAAGFKAGDVIQKIDGEAITSTDQMIAIIGANAEKEVTITVLRDDSPLNVSVTPKTSDTEGKGRIGVMLENPYRPVESLWETIPLSVRATYGFAQELLALPGRWLAGTLTPEEAQMGGPRTIWNLFQQAVQRDTESRAAVPTGGGGSTPSHYTLLLIISLTISVGTLNLIPIPALDGGRIFMSLIEVVIRRPIPARYQMAINGIGYIILLGLLGIFYIKDIISPVVINLP